MDYVVDLMCKDLLLILEADGEVHELDDQKKHDEKRTLVLEQAGFTILRFSNWEIKNRPDFVEAEIRAWIRKKTGMEDLASTPQPPSKGEDDFCLCSVLAFTFQCTRLSLVCNYTIKTIISLKAQSLLHIRRLRVNPPTPFQGGG
jgi:hypothetical protein